MLSKLVEKSESVLSNKYEEIDKIVYKNSKKVLDAFHEVKLTENDFYGTTGYGYGDIGRDKIERIYSIIFGTEDALVRNQFISGTHAISTALFGVLRPGNLMLSISGKPYDTLDSIIGFNDNKSSLKSFGIKYDQIDLIDNVFDNDKIREYITCNKVDVIYIQRSRGYSTRDCISIDSIEKVIKLIRSINIDIVVIVDNCYCEFVGLIEPSEVGADLTIGSLIKNLGGGIASNGAYIVGRKDLIHLCSERLNVAGEAKEVGPSLGANKLILQGLYLAPSVVGNALKTAIFAAFILEELGYKVFPKWNDDRSDIVQTIYFNDKNKLIKFVQGIQEGSAIDSNALPEPSDMPGYNDQIIMASGSFTQGSSIEISCDGPLREPYIAYLQGGITFEYGKLAVLKGISNLEK